MTTQHVYLFVYVLLVLLIKPDAPWLRNLDAFQDGVDNILDHHLRVDSSRVVDLDGNAIPLGDFVNVTGTPFDFRTEEKVGARWDAAKDLCGSGMSATQILFLRNLS